MRGYNVCFASGVEFTRDRGYYSFTECYQNFSTLPHAAACFLAPRISRSRLFHAGLVPEAFHFGLLGHFLLQHYHLLCMALHPSNYRASSRIVHGEGTGRSMPGSMPLQHPSHCHPLYSIPEWAVGAWEMGEPLVLQVQIFVLKLLLRLWRGRAVPQCPCPPGGDPLQCSVTLPVAEPCGSPPFPYLFFPL